MKIPLSFLLLFSASLAPSLKATEPILFEDTLEKTHGKIVYSSVLFRHGDRTPVFLFLDDEDPRVYTIWPEGGSQLTKIGKQQMYDLGKWFRARYLDKIKDGYRHDLLAANSTSTDRALMSGQVFMAGMFPPTEHEMWADDGLRWQPIPVRNTNDRMIGAHTPCDRYDLEKKLLGLTPEFQKLNSTFTDVFEYVARHSKYGPMSATDVIRNINLCWDCYNEIYIEELYNLTIPSWTKKIYPEPLRYLAKLHFALLAYTPEMKRLSGGELVTQMLNEMQQKRAGLRNEMFHIYAAHETIVSIFLDTLSMFNFIVPPPGASVIVELRVKNEEYVVTILFKNSTDHLPYFMQIPGCDDICSLDKFAELMAQFVVEDWEAECELGILEEIYYHTSIFTVIVWIIVICLAVGVVFVCIRTIKKRERSLQYTIIPD